MAEGILREKAESAGVDFEIDSCGTGGWHVGEAPDPRSQTKMVEKGLDISSLRARQFKSSDFEDFDLIYCMDASNFDHVTTMAPNEQLAAKVKMILNESNPEANQNVPDPYYGGRDGFETVFQLLDEACDVIVKKYS